MTDVGEVIPGSDGVVMPTIEFIREQIAEFGREQPAWPREIRMHPETYDALKRAVTDTVTVPISWPFSAAWGIPIIIDDTVDPGVVSYVWPEEPT